MQLRRVTGVTGIAMSLVLLAGCTGGKAVVATPSATVTPAPSVSASDSGSPTASTSATPTPTLSAPPVDAPALHSLSGLPGTAGKPVIAVKIDNTPPGRPQYGVNDADVVYCEQVEGGETRLMALYQSKLPTRVGPNRSGRQTDLEILAMYGKVGFAFSGANRHVLVMIRDAPVVSVDEDNGGFFFRDNSRYAPYNLYLNLQSLLRQRPSIATVKDNGLHFGTPAPGGTPVTTLDVAMSAYIHIGFSYDAASHHWLESQDGHRNFVASGERISATNVLIQEVTVVRSRFADVLGNNTPFAHTVGAGKFRVLRPDGTTMTGTWYRHAKSSPTTYTLSDGSPLTLVPGRTWILLAPKGNRISAT